MDRGIEYYEDGHVVDFSYSDDEIIAHMAAVLFQFEEMLAGKDAEIEDNDTEEEVSLLKEDFFQRHQRKKKK